MVLNFGGRLYECFYEAALWWAAEKELHPQEGWERAFVRHFCFLLGDISRIICVERPGKVAVVPCAHVFCRACIERWSDICRASTGGRALCPICRGVVLTPISTDPLTGNYAATLP